MTVVDRLIPSVDAASDEYRYHGWFLWALNPGPLRDRCALNVDAASVAYDMAVAQASDARRAEADRLRAEVAW